MKSYDMFHYATESMMESRDKMNHPKSWAHRIMENPSKYPDIAKKYAQQALASKTILSKLD